MQKPELGRTVRGDDYSQPVTHFLILAVAARRLEDGSSLPDHWEEPFFQTSARTPPT